jgi:hypothetical protein
MTTVNQNPPQVHHPLNARYYSIVEEPQLRLMFGFTLVTNYVGNMFHI